MNRNATQWLLLTATGLALVWTRPDARAASGTLQTSTLTFLGSATANLAFVVRTDIAAGADGATIQLEFAPDGTNAALRSEPFSPPSVSFSVSYNGATMGGFPCTAQQAINGCAGTSTDPVVLLSKQASSFGRYTLTISFPNGSSKFTAGWALGIGGIPVAPTGVRGNASVVNGSFRAPLSPAGGVDALPSGAIMFFNLTSCPAGWADATAAQGRYLVGMPSSGTLAGTAGSALADRENRAIGQHSHVLSDPGHNHQVNDSGHAHGVGAGTRYVFWNTSTCDGYVGSFPSGKGNCLDAATSTGGNTTTGISLSSATTGITLASAGTVSGTNAPYIQYRICQKN